MIGPQPLTSTRPLLVFATPNSAKADWVEQSFKRNGVVYGRGLGREAGGRVEISFVIPAHYAERSEGPQGGAVKYALRGQSSVLWIGPTHADGMGNLKARRAWFLDHNGARTYAGKLRMGTADKGWGMAGWSRFDGYTWVIEPHCGPDPIGLSATDDLAEAMREYTGPDVPPALFWEGPKAPDLTACGNPAGFECGWQC